MMSMSIGVMSVVAERTMLRHHRATIAPIAEAQGATSAQIHQFLAGKRKEMRKKGYDKNDKDNDDFL